MPGKRAEYLDWDEYFMGNAILASMRSKDPNNQVGACIVNEETKKILSIGYNGLPRGFDDNKFDWLSTGEKTGILKHIKNYYVVHAERNAVLNYSGDTKDLEGATMYITWFPCYECTKEIVQVGIKKIVYLRMFSNLAEVEISKIMFRAAGVEIIEYNREREISREEFQESSKSIQKIIKGFKNNR